MGKKKDKSAAHDTAVIYARYSSHNQTDQSIEGQVAAAEAFAVKKGYKIIKTYADRAKTGRNDNREAFQEMLKDTETGAFGVILVWKVDRFGRNKEEIAYNKYRCKKHGVRVEYVAENLPDGPEAVILESVFEGMAEYFSLQLSQNVRRGQMESAKKHHAIGGHVPLGYRVGPDKGYEIEPREAEIVREIFRQYAAGLTISELCAHLNGMGYRTKAGRPFTKNSFSNILGNPRYIGTYIFKDYIAEDAIPAIIDKETYNKCQDMLKQNRRMPSHKWSYSDYILTDKLYCGHCGERMIGESGIGKLGKKYSYYICAGRRHGSGCKKRPVRQEYIEDAVFSQVHAILENKELLEYIIDRTWSYYVEHDQSREKLEALEKELRGVQNAQRNLVRTIELGLLNDAITERLEELTKQESDLRAAIAEANLAAGIQFTREHIEFFFSEMQKLNYKDRECQKRLVDVFVSAIYLYDDRLKLVFNFKSDGKEVKLEDLEEPDNSAEGFDCCVPSPAFKLTYKPKIGWIIELKLPDFY